MSCIFENCKNDSSHFLEIDYGVKECLKSNVCDIHHRLIKDSPVHFTTLQQIESKI
jgi:hypothetical protein